MKRIILFSTIFLVFSSTISAQEGIDEECVNCKGNEINNTSSALGVLNIATGVTSFASGEMNSSLGDYSNTLGYGNIAEGKYSFAGGENCIASGKRSFAFGRYAVSESSISLALGSFNRAYGTNAIAMGCFVEATNENAVVIGRGAGNDERIVNNLSNTMMVGFNSNLHTFFIDRANGFNTTGRIGIGNITDPEAKLHIRGDNDPYNSLDASLFIESDGNYYSTFYIGDKDHYLKTKPGHDLEFNAAGNDFYFNNGNVGIGTSSPSEKLEVDGNIKAGAIEIDDFKMATNDYGAGKLLQSDEAGNATWVDPPETGDDDWSFGSYENIFRMDGNVGIGIDQPIYRLHVKNDGQDYAAHFDNTSPYGKGVLIRAAYGAEDVQMLDLKNYYGASVFNVDSEGDVGIGTTETGIYKLAVAGSIRAEEVQIEHLDKWYDCVFENDYNLPSLSDIEAFVKENKHLPEVPSEEDVMEQGINLGEMNAILLKKVEELTLHLIEQQKQIEELKKALQ